MSATIKLDLHYTYKKMKSIKIKDLTYINDSAWIITTKTNIKKKLKIIKSFFRMSRIDLNPKKSELIVINRTKVRNNNNNKALSILFNNYTITAIEKG